MNVRPAITVAQALPLVDELAKGKRVNDREREALAVLLDEVRKRVRSRAEHFGEVVAALRTAQGPVCGDCGASGDEPCIGPNGQRLRVHHAARRTLGLAFMGGGRL